MFKRRFKDILKSINKETDINVSIEEIIKERFPNKTKSVVSKIKFKIKTKATFENKKMVEEVKQLKNSILIGDDLKANKVEKISSLIINFGGLGPMGRCLYDNFKVSEFLNGRLGIEISSNNPTYPNPSIRFIQLEDINLDLFGEASKH